MSRLDPNGSDFDPKTKTTVSLGPSAEDIQTKGEEGQVMPEGPIKTAASYGDRARARKAATAAIKKGGKPLGGAPPLPADKMQQIADGLAPKPLFGDEPPTSPKPSRAVHEPPAEKPVQGVGAAYHVNQEMAKGRVDRPVTMREAKKMAQEAKEAPSTLSPESVKAIETMNEMAETAPTEGAQPDMDLREEEMDDVEAELAVNESEVDLDYVGLAEARLTLLDPKRKKAIEDRLEEMDISDMITKRELRQEVPVIEGKLKYTFRTFNQHEHLFCLQYVFEQRGSAAYSEELLNTVKLVCALVAINGAPLPDHRTHVGTAKEAVDEKEFKKKMFHVASFPTQMIADFSVQAIWFTERVNKLFSLDELKNG